MKIIVEITPEKRITLEAPMDDVSHILVKMQMLLREVNAKAPPAPPKLPSFVCSTWCGSVSRELIASDAFTAAECFAGLMLPNQRLPWKHMDRDFEKLRHFGDRFSHRVRSAEGKTLPVIVKEVR